MHIAIEEGEKKEVKKEGRVGGVKEGMKRGREEENK